MTTKLVLLPPELFTYTTSKTFLKGMEEKAGADKNKPNAPRHVPNPRQKGKKSHVTEQQVRHKLAMKAEKARLQAELKGHHVVCKECFELIVTVNKFAEENRINREEEFVKIMKNATEALSATKHALAKAKHLTGWKRDDVMKNIPGVLTALRKNVLVVAQWLRVHKRRLAILTAEETDKRSHANHDDVVMQINTRGSAKELVRGSRGVEAFDEEVVDEKGRLFGSISPISTPSTPGQHNFTAHSTPDYGKHQVPIHSQNNFDAFFDAINAHGENQYDVNDIVSTALPKTLPKYDKDVPKTLMMTQEHIDRHYKTPERPASNLAKQFAESPRLKYHYENGIIKDNKVQKTRAPIRCPLCTLRLPCEHYANIEKIPLKLLHKAKRDISMFEDKHYSYKIQASVVLCASSAKGTHLLKYVERHLVFLKRCLVLSHVDGALKDLLAAKLPNCINMSCDQVIKTIKTSKPNLVVIFRGTTLLHNNSSENSIRKADQLDEMVRLSERHNTPFAANESSASIMIQHLASTWS